MLRALVSISIIGTFALAGCGSDAPKQEGYDQGDAVAGATSPESPNFTAAPYPAAPFGTQIGSTIDNFEFLGWAQPEAAGFDENAFQKVRLSDFYDPDGTKGYKVIMINSSAGWCSVCRAEYKGSYGICENSWDTCTQNSHCCPTSSPSCGIQCVKKSMNQHYLELKDQGVVFIGSLFEDSANPPKPAKPIDLHNWAQIYTVTFPMALDPGFKLGTFFSADATPMNLVVDARTMKITGKVLGGDIGELFKIIDETLKQ